MKVGIAQINTKVGDLLHNENKIIDAIKTLGKQSDVIVFPELTTTGYPPRDLLFDDGFVRDQKDIIYRVRDLVSSIKSDLKVLLGYVDYDAAQINPYGDFAKYNSCAIISRDIQTYQKQLLPNYDVFNEPRYFKSGNQEKYFNIKDDLASVLICEDIWDQAYQNKPMLRISQKGVKSVFDISASPFSIGKLKTRYELIRNHIENGNNAFRFVYVNQVGAQDELVFDGGSFIVGRSGFVKYLAPSFEESLTVVDWNEQGCSCQQDRLFEQSKDKYCQVLGALKLGLNDYLQKSGMKKVVLGLSGGIDSAICAYVISRVLDKGDYEFVYMPSLHSKSLEDAQNLAGNLGADLNVVNINGFVDQFKDISQQNFITDLEGVSYENTQARIRGNILMMRANQTNAVVINTSNKTETALGYGTMYGDMIGGLSLIGDLNKREVYEFANYINKIEGKKIIPENIISKPASAELNEGQIDPFDYPKVSDLVDELLFGVQTDLISQKYDVEIPEVQRLKRLMKINEFKRKQGAPIIKLKNRSIGSGRVYPIV